MRRVNEFLLNLAPLLPLCGAYLGVTTACVALVYCSDRIFRPDPEPPRAYRVEDDPWAKNLAAENARMRWEGYQLRGRLAEHESEALRLRADLDALRRAGAVRVWEAPAAGPEVTPADLIPPQNVPLP